MMKKVLYLLAFALLLGESVKSQDFIIPEKYQFKEASDYAPYKPLIKKSVDWLISSPVHDKPTYRQQVGAFVFKWIEGVPDTHITIRGEFVGNLIADDAYKHTNALFLNYIAGLIQFALNNPESKDSVEAQINALNAMLLGYESIRDSAPNSYLDKLLKVQKKGKMRSWIEQNWRQPKTPSIKNQKLI